MIWQPRPGSSESVARAVDGVHVGPVRALAGVGTDSREDCTGGLFVALVGPRFDGHAHVGEALAKGAAAALVRRGRGQEAATRIEVEDTTAALGRLGRSARRTSSATVFGLTGSNGKTSSKELLAGLLEAIGRGPCHRTPGNLNNAIGLPMTLLGLGEHRSAVIEMGMNAPGEIDELTRLCEPDVVLVLNVGPAHIGRLGSLEAIAEAKGEAFRAAPQDAIRVANADDPRVMAQLEASGHSGLSYGWSPRAHIRIAERSPFPGGQSVRFHEPDLVIELPWAGAHQASNAAAAVACCVAAGLELPSRVDLRAQLAPLSGRGARLRRGPWTIVDESYNANPASTEAALRAVIEEAGESPVMLLMGAMGELGAHGERGHAKVGQRAAELGVAFVGTLGEGAEATAAAAAAAGVPSHHEREDAEALQSQAEAVLDDRPWWILVKGSRASRMERFAQRLGAA
ncbi:MAG: UDP-N-acetylmuramoyl-tripeptide--D-alanyl-D-alanine ligase [Myxococcota bacterium]